LNIDPHRLPVNTNNTVTIATGSAGRQC